MNQFFATEAERYLDRLDALLAEQALDADELFRLARGVRGSAHMAGSKTIARVAERLENVAVAVLQRHVVWSEGVQELARQTASDLRVLIRALNRWGPAEEQRVRAAIERWDELPGAAPDATAAATAVADRAGLDRGGAEGAPDEPLAAALAAYRDPRWSPAERALRDALALRPLLEEMADRRGAMDDDMEGLIEELFGLVRAGLQASAPRGSGS